MDPNAAWRELEGICATDDRARVAELADALIGWLEKDGFLPDAGELGRCFGAMGRRGLLAHLRSIRRVAEMR